MTNSYLDRLSAESVRLLKEVGFDWQPSLPGFYNRDLEKGISYHAVRDSTPAQIVEWIKLARYDEDEREWVCEPRGPLTIATADLANLSADPRQRWASHNAIAAEVIEDVEKRQPVTLSELRGIAGGFVARHRKTGDTITSEALKHNPIKPPTDG